MLDRQRLRFRQRGFGIAALVTAACLMLLLSKNRD